MDLTYLQDEPKSSPELPHEPSPRKKRLFVLACGAALLVAALFYSQWIAAPRSFPAGTLYTVERGETLSGVSQDLASRGMIRSQFFFKSFVTLFGTGKGVKAGDYEFDDRDNVVTIAWRLTRASYDLTRVRITVPEGTNSVQLTELVAARFPRVAVKDFYELAKRNEGYLFPDTYFFLPNAGPQEIVDAMIANYEAKIGGIEELVADFGKPVEDVITMASIIEEEARTTETRRTIAGILWKRLAEGMPLQVDAAFAYVNGKARSSDLTLDDLKIDSPYNTYVYRGLPPGPISNPGLETIRDTLTPIPTKYYYYLSDAEGNMHYAVTHAEHVANKDKYLR